MKEIKYMVYKFNELPEKSKKNVLRNYECINIDRNWWKDIDDDAKAVGLKIIGFDVDGGCFCKGIWNKTPLTVIKIIKASHGKDRETYKTAVKYSELLKGKDQKAVDAFKKELLENYRFMIQEKYQYLTSDKVIQEKLEAHDYDFTIDGKIH